MKTKLLGLLVGAAMLAGCSLAQPDTAAQEPDRLVGAVVTTEYIDTDMDITVNRNGTLELGEPKRIEGVPVYIEGSDRLERVEFPGVEGYTMLLYRYDSKEGSFVSNLADDEFYDLGIHTNVTDEGETNTIYGSLKADLSTGRMVHFYTNPVYQTPEGGFYLIPGSGISTDCGDGTDFRMSQSIDEQFSETDGVESSHSGSRVELTYESAYPGERFTLLQLDSGNHVIKEESWQPEQLPNEVTLEPETELVLVETHYADRNGETHTGAEVFGRGAFVWDEETGTSTQFVRLYLPGADGVCQVKPMILTAK